MNYKVAVIQRVLPEYRVNLFDRMSTKLHDMGVDLKIFSGQHKNGESIISMSPELSWSVKVKNRYISILGKSLVIQKVNIRDIISADLVVVEQANASILNLLLLVLRPFYGFKIAFWGHGYNRQSNNEHSVSEKVKKRLINLSDWWFSYTPGTAKYLIAQGVNDKIISTLRNTFDTDAFQNDLNSIADSDIAQFKLRYGISGNNVGLYCGGLYKHKNICFLLDSALMIRKSIPNFELLVVGTGPDTDIVEKFAGNNSWVHYIGPQYGREKATAFKLSKCLLIPGAIGLSVVDSIVAALPLITIELDTHGPEFEYLQDSACGFVVSADTQKYALAVIDLLLNEERLNRHIQSCRDHANQYSLDYMVDSFSTGIVNAINSSEVTS